MVIFNVLRRLLYHDWVPGSSLLSGSFAIPTLSEHTQMSSPLQWLPHHPVSLLALLRKQNLIIAFLTGCVLDSRHNHSSKPCAAKRKANNHECDIMILLSMGKVHHMHWLWTSFQTTHLLPKIYLRYTTNRFLRRSSVQSWGRLQRRISLVSSLFGVSALANVEFAFSVAVLGTNRWPSLNRPLCPPDTSLGALPLG